jgi:hypothetical protein
MGRACSTYGGRIKAYTGFWWGNLRELDNLEDPRYIKMDLQEVGTWTGSSWLRIGTGGRHM